MPGPVEGVGWGEALLAVSRLWDRLPEKDQDTLAERELAVRLPQERQETYQRLAAWTAGGRRPHRSLTIDGEPVGEWLWQELNVGGAIGDRQRPALIEAAGDIDDVMPYLPPAQPRRPSYDRARRAHSLEELLDRDEQLCRFERAPAISRPGPPDPDRGLVVMVSLGYRSPKGTFTLALAPGHTWFHLAQAINDVYARDDDHLSVFFFHPVDWKIAPNFGRYQDRFEEILIDHLQNSPGPPVPLAPLDVPGPDTPVSAMCAPGYALGHLCDFGDKWLHSLRVLRWTHPEEDRQATTRRPLLGIRPAAGPPGQYPGDRSPGRRHYLRLPTLEHARPN
ncbi:hypothetical protein OHU45_02395 [Streptomyces tubercidicus]|uniref:hypothetical protein n=1 Tax=Streptomyces tubercidicus TaxID=47759 RepID=UPI003252EC07